MDSHRSLIPENGTFSPQKSESKDFENHLQTSNHEILSKLVLSGRLSWNHLTDIIIY